MNKTKILLLCQHYYPEMVSTGLHMTELTTKMVELDTSIQINVFCAEPAKEEYFQDSIKSNDEYKAVKIKRVSNIGKQHGSISSRVLFSLLFFIKTLNYAIIQRNRYDIIICTTNPPIVSIIPYLIKKLFRKPYIIIVYDVYPDIAVKLGIIKEFRFIAIFFRWLNVRVYNAAEKVVVIGVDMAELVRKSMKIADENKLSLIHNWSDKNTVTPIRKDENTFIKKYNLQKKKILLYSGNMGRTHNIEPILEAAKVLKDEENIIFIFIGSGAKKKKISDFKEQNGLNNILQLPYQPIEIISHTLSSADIAFVCLEKEFTGLSVPSKAYGIMAAKVPIIGLLDSQSEIAKMLKKHNCGLIWEDGSTQTLSELIIQMLNNESELNNMAQNAYNVFLQNYDISISASKYNSLIKSILLG